MAQPCPPRRLIEPIALLPALSMAVTVSTWGPSAKLSSACPDCVFTMEPSSLTSVVATPLLLSVAENVRVGVGLLVKLMSAGEVTATAGRDQVAFVHVEPGVVGSTARAVERQGHGESAGRESGKA